MVVLGIAAVTSITFGQFYSSYVTHNVQYSNSQCFSMFNSQCVSFFMVKPPFFMVKPHLFMVKPWLNHHFSPVWFAEIPTCLLWDATNTPPQALEAAEERPPMSIGSKTVAFMAAVNSSRSMIFSVAPSLDRTFRGIIYSILF